MKLYMFRTVPLSIVRSFHCTHSIRYMSYRFDDIYLLLCVQWKNPDDGQRNCTQHV